MPHHKASCNKDASKPGEATHGPPETESDRILQQAYTCIMHASGSLLCLGMALHIVCGAIEQTALTMHEASCCSSGESAPRTSGAAQHARPSLMRDKFRLMSVDGHAYRQLVLCCTSRVSREDPAEHCQACHSTAEHAMFHCWLSFRSASASEIVIGCLICMTATHLCTHVTLAVCFIEDLFCRTFRSSSSHIRM